MTAGAVMRKPSDDQQRLPTPQRPRLVKQRKPPHPYHAVSIQPGLSACAAAYRCCGTRVLSRDAPSLPLPDCDALHCECQYRDYPDRRVGPRRRSNGSGGWEGEERRQLAGRRSTDRSQ